MVNKKLTTKRGKIFAFFADLKAAFDKIDRTKLGEMLKRANINERLRKRIMETYRETMNVIKVGNKKSGIFWTKKRSKTGLSNEPCAVQYIPDGFGVGNEERTDRRSGNREREILDSDVCGRYSVGSEERTRNERNAKEI